MWLGEEVAEKKFFGPDHPSFMKEVEILAGLAHPNIVPLIGYAMDGDRCFIIVELMDGDLSSLMEERSRQKVPFSDFEAVDMMLQTAQGMLYLHENKIVHRDLKAQNILVKSRKDTDAKYVCAKVSDFGLSRTRESSSSYSAQTLNTGTTRWMAPELMLPGDGHLRAKMPNHEQELKYPFKVDVYSLGMVCYEILTGEVPFRTISSHKEVKKMVSKGSRPDVPDRCPQSLKTLIQSCSDAEASCRPSFADICKRLRSLKCSMMICSNSKGSKPGSFEAIRALEFNRIISRNEWDFYQKYKIGAIIGAGGQFSAIAIEISTGNEFLVTCIV